MVQRNGQPFAHTKTTTTPDHRQLIQETIMTVAKLPDPSLQSKRISKKSVTFACKFNLPAAQKISCDGALQSTDKRRHYMRRGSKTPTMLKLATLDSSLFNQDFSKTCWCASERSKTICELLHSDETTSRVLDNAPQLDLQTRLLLFRNKRRSIKSGSISPRSIFSCDFETANAHEPADVMQEPARRRMSMMSSLKQNFDKATISASSHPLRRMSMELVM